MSVKPRFSFGGIESLTDKVDDFEFYGPTIVKAEFNCKPVDYRVKISTTAELIRLDKDDGSIFGELSTRNPNLDYSEADSDSLLDVGYATLNEVLCFFKAYIANAQYTLPGNVSISPNDNPVILAGDLYLPKPITIDEVK